MKYILLTFYIIAFSGVLFLLGVLRIINFENFSPIIFLTFGYVNFITAPIYLNLLISSFVFYKYIFDYRNMRNINLNYYFIILLFFICSLLSNIVEKENGNSIFYNFNDDFGFALTKAEPVLKFTSKSLIKSIKFLFGKYALNEFNLASISNSISFFFLLILISVNLFHIVFVKLKFPNTKIKFI